MRREIQRTCNVGWGALLLAVLGCQGQSVPTLPTKGGSAPAAGNAAASAETLPGGLPADSWFACYQQGTKIGHMHVQARQTTDAEGNPLISANSQTEFTIRRGNNFNQLRVVLSSVESLRGTLYEFTGEVNLASQPQRYRGTRQGDEFVLETTVGDRTQTQRIPWNEQLGGLLAIDLALLSSPLEAGETRELTAFQPIVNQPARITLVAHERESIEMLGELRELRRIQASIQLPAGIPLQFTYWCDDTGLVQRTHDASSDQVQYRSTRAQALAPETESPPDLLEQTLVRLDRPIKDASRTTQARYRLQLPSANPADAFWSGPGQQVEPVDEHTAEVLVTAIAARDPQVADPASAADPVTKADTETSSMIDFTDERVSELARDAAPEELTGWPLALALEGYVHQLMEGRRDYSKVLSPASEVARTRQGDCTEHSVLLAALARARGLPARVAVGLVYLESPDRDNGTTRPGFGFHMWNEVHVAGRWLPLDAVLPPDPERRGIGAAHLKLTHSSLPDGTAQGELISVAAIQGKLKIQVLNVEYGNATGR